MKRIFFVLVSIIVVACSSEFSNDVFDTPEISTNLESSSSKQINISFTEGLSSSAVSYGINPVDTTDRSGVDAGGIMTNVTSSSMTEWKFRTEPTILYSVFEPNFLCVSTFYEERGSQITASDNNGSYGVTFRLVDSAENLYVVWLWDVIYRRNVESSRSRDRDSFMERCSSYIGEYKDYIGDDASGDRYRRLQLSCVFPRMTELSDNDLLDSIALAEVDFVKEYWNALDDAAGSATTVESSASSSMMER